MRSMFLWLTLFSSGQGWADPRPYPSTEIVLADKAFSQHLKTAWLLRNPGPLTRLTFVGNDVSLDLGTWRNIRRHQIDYTLMLSGEALDPSWDDIREPDHRYLAKVRALKPGIGHVKVYFCGGDFKKPKLYPVVDLTITVKPKPASTLSPVDHSVSPRSLTFTPPAL